MNKFFEGSATLMSGKSIELTVTIQSQPKKLPSFQQAGISQPTKITASLKQVGFTLASGTLK